MKGTIGAQQQQQKRAVVSWYCPRPCSVASPAFPFAWFCLWWGNKKLRAFAKVSKLNLHYFSIFAPSDAGCVQGKMERKVKNSGAVQSGGFQLASVLSGICVGKNDSHILSVAKWIERTKQNNNSEKRSKVSFSSHLLCCLCVCVYVCARVCSSHYVAVRFGWWSIASAIECAGFVCWMGNILPFLWRWSNTVKQRSQSSSQKATGRREGGE